MFKQEQANLHSVTVVLVAIGANLPAGDGAPPIATCAWAARAVADALGGLASRARWFSSAAWPDPAGPRYVNGVLRLDAPSLGSPALAMARLHAIESEAGRVRGPANAPRTLDLDLIDWDGMVANDVPTLPHPRLAARGFVLRPLRDVAPGWRHPVSLASVDALIAALPPEDTAPL